MTRSESVQKSIRSITPYPDINLVLESLSAGVKKILKNKLKGLYLFGSLVYGDFKPGRSDIDLVVVVNRPLEDNELKRIEALHQALGSTYPCWKDRLECSYVPHSLLSNLMPPEAPRPYYGGGIFYTGADYGNEWIINNYLLSKYSTSLIGPDFLSLIKPIDIVEVQKACIRDLFKEWEPKKKEPGWLDNDHYQSYLVLNLCRILYTVFCSETASKTVSAQWVKGHYPRWQELIEAAENWEYGKAMAFKEEAIHFIDFTVKKIKEKYEVSLIA
jgi:predicted nucleotidyltransferase